MMKNNDVGSSDKKLVKGAFYLPPLPLVNKILPFNDLMVSIGKGVKSDAPISDNTLRSFLKPNASVTKKSYAKLNSWLMPEVGFDIEAVEEYIFDSYDDSYISESANDWKALILGLNTNIELIRKDGIFQIFDVLNELIQSEQHMLDGLMSMDVSQKCRTEKIYSYKATNNIFEGFSVEYLDQEISGPFSQLSDKGQAVYCSLLVLNLLSIFDAFI